MKPIEGQKVEVLVKYLWKAHIDASTIQFLEVAVKVLLISHQEGVFLAPPRMEEIARPDGRVNPARWTDRQPADPANIRPFLSLKLNRSSQSVVITACVIPIGHDILFFLGCSHGLT